MVNIIHYHIAHDDVHVTGPNFRASVAIVGGTILTGALPAQVLREVQHWLDAHRPRVLDHWRTHNPML